MNLPLLSPAALDNAVYDLVVREPGVANAMRFIARHSQPDGIDYTRDRNNWLSQDADEIDRLFAKSAPELDLLMANSRQSGKRSRRQAKTPSRKGITQKRK